MKRWALALVFVASVASVRSADARAARWNPIAADTAVARRDSLEIAADSLDTEDRRALDQARAVDREDTARTRRTPPPEPLVGFDRPRWVMLRSLAVPGWGQFHNGSWIKGTAIAAGEAWLGWKVVEDRRELDRLSTAVELARQNDDDALQEQLVNAYNDRLDQSISRQWLLGGLVAYSLLDAYVDAHFRNFRLEFETDPALPGGRPRERGARVSLRGSF